MKKLIFTLLVLVAAATVNAQWYVGGSFSLNSYSAEDGYEDDVRFKFAPELGYNFDENVAVGVALYYVSQNESVVSDEKMSGFSIEPYVRYSFFKSNNFTFFIDGGIGAYAGDFDGFYLGLKPGIGYKLSEKFALDAHVGFLGYKDKDYVGSSAYKSKIGLDLTNALSFSLYYEF